MRSELFQIGNLQYWKKNVDFFKCLKICEFNESSPTERTVCYESFVEYALMFNQVKSL